MVLTVVLPRFINICVVIFNFMTTGLACVLQRSRHPFNFTMKKTNRITLVALFAVLTAMGLQAQTTGTTTGTTTGSTTGGTTSGGTTTGGTTTGGTTTGGTTTGGTTTGGTTTGGSTTGGSTTGGTTTTTTPTTTTTTGGNANAKGKDKPKGPNANASDNAKEVHEVLAEFRTIREGYLAQRKALLEQLKGASEEKKKEILEQLRKESAERDEEERALGKQIRDDLKKLRETRGTGE
jgi:hypothetical protein